MSAILPFEEKNMLNEDMKLAVDRVRCLEYDLGNIIGVPNRLQHV